MVEHPDGDAWCSGVQGVPGDAGLGQVQENLGVLGIVLVPGVVDSVADAGHANGMLQSVQIGAPIAYAACTKVRRGEMLASG